MTFSIVARCESTGMFGVAVSSSSPAVAARCAFAQARVGAVASQNVTDPALGTRALQLMELGASASEALIILKQSNGNMEFRQVLAVDGAGTSAIHSGASALGIWGEARANNVACGGNMLADSNVPQAMVDFFIGSCGGLGDRLIGAMWAGLRSGGEAGPIRSSGLKLVREMSWPIADLRCDWSTNCPIEELAAIWEVYKPQLEAYVTRAVDPSVAPRFGVRGDD